MYKYSMLHHTRVHVHVHNPPSHFSKLGIHAMFVCLGYGWVGYFTFLFLLLSFKLVCYFHVYVYMYMYTCFNER